MNKEELLQDVINHFGISITQFDGNSRRENIVISRQLYCYILNKSGIRICNISKEMGKNHSIITHSIKKIENEIETNKDMDIFVTELLNKYVI